jgi:flagellar biosynthetic protein FliS
MNALRAYQTNSAPACTRIDVLLALFEGAIERLQAAAAMMRQNNPFPAMSLLAKAQLIVAELASGVNPDAGEVSVNLLRLYEFVSYSITTRRPGQLDAAVRVLCSLKQGFDTIRDEAVELERKGAIPAVDVSHLVQMTA